MPGSRLSMASERRSEAAVVVDPEEETMNDEEEVTETSNNTGRAVTDEGNDDLTNLTWLQNRNLLQGCIAVGGASGAGTGSAAVVVNRAVTRQPHEDLDDESQRRHPHQHQHYNPTVHVCSKPPYSFSCLIFMAIEDSPNRALPVKDIYSWILAHFPYFQNAPTGWKNSVRHNLSLNKCFLKVDKGQNIAKGSLWCVDPEHRPNMLQALRKTPFKPFIRLPSDSSAAAAAVDHLGSYAPVLVAAANRNANLLNPVLFPYLSRRLTTSPPTEDVEVDAAATMLSLKNGPRLLRDRSSSTGNGDGARSRRKREDIGGGKTVSTFNPARERRLHDRHGVPKADRRDTSQQQPSVIVCGSMTMSSSPHVDDHTYSSSSTTNSPVRPTNNGESPSSSIDEPFEFGGIANGYDRDGFYPSPPTSGGDSGVMRSDSEEDEEEDDDDNRRPKSVRCPVIVRTVTTASGHCRVLVENEEQMKIVEGADALLNLAGFSNRVAAATAAAAAQGVAASTTPPRRKRKPSRRHLRHVLPVDHDKARR